MYIDFGRFSIWTLKGMHLHLHLKCLPELYVSSTFNVLLFIEAQQQLRTAPSQLTGQQSKDSLGEFWKPALSMLNYASEVYLHFHPLKMQIEGNIWHLKLLSPYNSELLLVIYCCSSCQYITLNIVPQAALPQASGFCEWSCNNSCLPHIIQTLRAVQSDNEQLRDNKPKLLILK